mgnify:CR=1 FL=1|jgi:uncharacterized protein YcfJ
MKKAILFTTSVFVTFAVTAQADVSAKITDYYKDVINTQPYQVEVCSNVHVPGDRSGDMLRGAIIGGIIGNNVTKNLPDGGTAGAIIGGLFGHSNSNATGGTQRQCRTETHYNDSHERVYDYSVMTFYYDGKRQRVRFRKN